MTSPVVTAPSSETLEEVAKLMLERRTGSVVIVDPAEREKPVGIVTETDFMLRDERVPFSYPLLRAPKLFGDWVQSSDAFESAYESWKARPVGEIMSSPPHTVEENSLIWEAARAMVEHNVNRLPVVRDGRLAGIVARHDLLKCVASERSGPTADAVVG